MINTLLSRRKISFSKETQRGFSLIELVVVIVILAIIGITAVPRFIDISSDARVSQIEGIAGAVNGAAQLTKALAVVNNTAAGGMVTVDGKAVQVSETQYPVVAGEESIRGATNITSPIPTCDGVTAMTCTWEVQQNCKVVYSEITGIATVTTEGC